jgi:dTDP-4-dehydrorhamnose 3,5-epimerase
MTLPYAAETGDLPGVRIITPQRFRDRRGWTGEVFHAAAFKELGVDADWVQDNHSWSETAGTVRALHHQRPPHPQAKLTRCVRGAILHVIVDLRRSSPTFGRADVRKLTPQDGAWIYAPLGCTQGFMTLAHETEVHFKASDAFMAPLRAGLIWNDPDLAIPWPKALAAQAIVSDADSGLPRLKALVAAGETFT